MNYRIEFKPKAIKDLKAIDKAEARRIIEKIGELTNDLTGDIKRLTRFTPEFRLRCGNYRVPFEVEDERVVIYRVRHRKNAYS